MAKEKKEPEFLLTRVDEDMEMRPRAIQLQGVKFVAVEAIDERWVVEEPPTEWRQDAPVEILYYVVTLEDGT